MVIGQNINNITASYFVIDGVPLLLESTKKAVAVAFYAYHSFYTRYPTQSARLWVVLERALFGLDDPNDKQSVTFAGYPEVKRLINALKV